MVAPDASPQRGHRMVGAKFLLGSVALAQGIDTIMLAHTKGDVLRVQTRLSLELYEAIVRLPWRQSRRRGQRLNWRRLFHGGGAYSGSTGIGARARGGCPGSGGRP